MLAPRRVPPCFTASVAILNTFIKLMGPEATPPVVLTVLPLERKREKENPVPPAGFMNQGRLFDGIKDLFHATAYR